MKIAVQEKSGPFWGFWVQEIKKAGHECILLNLCTESGFQEALHCDGVMWHVGMTFIEQTAANSILTALEIAGNKTVFPNLSTRWHFDNKVSQAYLFKQMGVNTPENTVFWSEEDAINWLQNYKCFPLVAKLKRGSSSSAVYILENIKEAERHVRKAFSFKGVSGETGGARKTTSRQLRIYLRNSLLKLPKSFLDPFLKLRPRMREVWPNERGYAYFQEFLPRNNFDTRVTIIGNRAFAFRRFNRDNDFRASGSGKIDYNLQEINMRMVEVAHEISFQNKFQSMSYDFLIDKEGKPSIVEMSYGYQSKAVFDCLGHWNRDLEWIEGKLLPEAAHVKDFLTQIAISSIGIN